MAAAKQKEQAEVVIKLDADALSVLRQQLAPEGAKPSYMSKAMLSFTDETERMIRDLVNASAACPNQRFTGKVCLEVEVRQDKDDNWVASPKVTGAAVSGKTERPYVDEPEARSSLDQLRLDLFGPVDTRPVENKSAEE